MAEHSCTQLRISLGPKLRSSGTTAEARGKGWYLAICSWEEYDGQKKKIANEKKHVSAVDDHHSYTWVDEADFENYNCLIMRIFNWKTSNHYDGFGRLLEIQNALHAPKMLTEHNKSLYTTYREKQNYEKISKMQKGAKRNEVKLWKMNRWAENWNSSIWDWSENSSSTKKKCSFFFKWKN